MRLGPLTGQGEGQRHLFRRRLDVEVAESGGMTAFPHRRWRPMADGGW
jgi:hypothetical protein